jgi:hypothetical protein
MDLLMSTPTIDCPKCGAKMQQEAIECPHCGVVFAKVKGIEAQGRSFPPRSEKATAVVADPAAGVVRLGRAAALACLAVWTWRFARAPMGAVALESILHLPNLVFHEAGHVLFGFLGEFMSAAGGSILQVTVPVVLAIAFLRRSDQFGAVVCTWWAGQNLLDLAPYIADARMLQLPLLGGRTGAEVEGHDWEYLLGSLGWLHLDRRLGLGAHRLGLAIMAGALVWGAVYLMRNRGQSRTPASDQ